MPLSEEENMTYLLSSESRDASKIPVSVIGGTGLVGRHLVKYLLNHPIFTVGFIVGSSKSAGRPFHDVWIEKESTLVNHYGMDLWTPEPYPKKLADLRVSSLKQLLAWGHGSGEGKGENENYDVANDTEYSPKFKYAISCVAPAVGFVEDELVAAGFKVFSISPYKRGQNLCVLEANYLKLDTGIDTMLFKSPNCVTCGSCVALSALSSKFGKFKNISITTFQSLSGRGDAKYPKEWVHGNVLPLRLASEKTESLIKKEIKTVLSHSLVGDVSVTAYRVSVQRGHLVDIRVKFEQDSSDITIDNIVKCMQEFKPLADIQKSGSLYSLPEYSINVNLESGFPRPKTHYKGRTTEIAKDSKSESLCTDGMRVSVGNFLIKDGVYDVCFTLVVDNIAKGAYGAALQMMEYYHWCNFSS